MGVALLVSIGLPALAGLPAPAASPSLPDEPLEIQELLVVERTSVGRRSPVVHDPLEAAWIAGELATPGEGTTVRGADGEEHAWRLLRAGEDGGFRDPALRGGWALARVRVEHAGVWILEARGHAQVWVGGAPRGGDVYDFGFVRLPIRLAEGENQLLFEAGRGALRARLVPAPADPYLELADPTLPDVVRGEAEPLLLGIGVGSPRGERVSGLTLEARLADGPPTRTALPALEPLSVRRLAASVAPPAQAAGEELALELVLRDAGGRELSRGSLALAVRGPDDVHVRTFESGIDGSVQLYAVRPPVPGTAEGPLDLVLSLHGAGVQARGQAACYAARPGLVLVAPTNRRPFGFDWEAWGRLDALEVLALAAERFGANPLRTYLTGHSMGGHGTWSLGAHLAGRLAAIAPSAGWSDFWSYGGKTPLDVEDPVQRLLDEAANASRAATLLQENYAQAGVYVLHGDADETVPVEEARAFRARLGTFHPDFAYYERPGAGHWWGAECMDWPPLVDFLRAHERPAPASVAHVAFATVDPAVNATCEWVTIHAQQRSLLPSRVAAAWSPGEEEGAGPAVTLETENVAALTLDLARFASGEAPHDVRVIDGDSALEAALPGDRRLRLVRAGDAWRAVEAHDPAGKGPARAGPLLGGLRRRFQLVYGTRGDAETTAGLRDLARFLAETFAYRGNGSLEVVPDSLFDPAREPDRDVVLLGDAQTHACWEALLGGSPIQVRPGLVRVGERELTGDDRLALFVRPRPGSRVASVVALAPTGRAGIRMAATLPLFVSGVAYPDWTVLSLEAWRRGAAGVLAAGFFGPDWSLAAGRSAWR